MLPARYDPFAGFPSIFSLRRDIDRIFSDFMRDFTNPGDVDVGDMAGEAAAIAPRFDVVEKGDAYVLRELAASVHERQRAHPYLHCPTITPSASGPRVRLTSL